MKFHTRIRNKTIKNLLTKGFTIEQVANEFFVTPGEIERRLAPKQGK